MKAYFEPKMNISVFDKADVVTTSGEIESQFDKTSSARTFGSTSYSNLKVANPEPVSASMTMSK